jgi:hypothetical protein
MASASRRLRIPQYFHASFVDLLRLNEGSYEELVKALEEATPTLFKGDLASFVADRVSFDAGIAKGLINALVSLYIVRRSGPQLTEAEFVDDVCKALDAAENPKLRPENGNWDTFKRRLERLLQFETSVGITSKALDVMWQNQRVFCDAGARMISDVRPVFKNGVSDPPIAAVVVHTLKIAYHEGGEVHEFYVALDSADLKFLRELLQREEDKLESLKSMLNVQYLEPGGH